MCRVVLPKSVDLDQVWYFTAFYRWDQSGVRRHREYIRALRTTDVEPVFGKFKSKDRKCRHYGKVTDPKARCCGCKGVFTVPEEKETDVNIAVRLLTAAIDDAYDTALLVTGDTDLLPAIRALHRQFPEKRVGVLTPPNRHAKQLIEEVDFNIRMKRAHLASCQFPDRIRLQDGSCVERPAEWV